MSQDFQQQLKCIRLTTHFDPRKSANLVINTRDKQQHITFNSECFLQSQEAFQQDRQRQLNFMRLQSVQIKFNSRTKAEPQIEFKPAQNDSLQLEQTLVKQQEQGKRKRKNREIWTPQKYQQILVHFRNLYFGVEARSLSKIAAQMGFCSRTIQIKWSEYQYDKSLPSIVNTLTTTNTRNRSVTTKTVLYIQLIRQILAQNSLVTTTQMAKLINQHLQANKSEIHKHQISADTVARLLKKANYVYQKVGFMPKYSQKELPEKDIIERRFQYCQLYRSFLNSGAELIFLDQTQISLYLKRKFCWIKKDKERAQALVIPKNKQSCISILCIITRTGAAGWRLFEQPLSKQTFTTTLKEILKKFLEKTDSKSRKILIMQNQSIHKMEVINLVSTVKDAFEVFYLPPYSQVFNPIQCFFRQLKDNIKNKKWANKKELLTVTKEILEGYKTFSFKPYFLRVESYIEEAKYKIKHQY